MTHRIIVTAHARRRLKEERQLGITTLDVKRAAAAFPGQLPGVTRLRGFVAKSGHIFDIVAKDTAFGRVVVTIIGRRGERP